jgi:uncharacterized membrane protein
MKKRTLEILQIIVWIFGFLAVGLLIYGIVRAILS